jgi:hypothetical protein
MGLVQRARLCGSTAALSARWTCSHRPGSRNQPLPMPATTPCGTPRASRTVVADRAHERVKAKQGHGFDRITASARLASRKAAATSPARLAGRAGPAARPLAGHEQSTGLFASGLGAGQRTSSMRRRRAGGAEVEDTPERRHHAPGDVAAGVHAAAGCSGAAATPAPHPLSWTAGTQRHAAGSSEGLRLAQLAPTFEGVDGLRRRRVSALRRRFASIRWLIWVGLDHSRTGLDAGERTLRTSMRRFPGASCRPRAAANSVRPPEQVRNGACTPTYDPRSMPQRAERDASRGFRHEPDSRLSS